MNKKTLQKIKYPAIYEKKNAVSFIDAQGTKQLLRKVLLTARSGVWIVNKYILFLCLRIIFSEYFWKKYGFINKYVILF